MQKFLLQPASLKPLLLQRTEYQSKGKWLSVKILRRLYERYFLTALEKNRQEEIAGLFFNDIQNDYRQISPHLPEKVSTIVDIGAGMGGINIFLQEHYQDKNPYFHLLDKNQMDLTFDYFYKDEASAYCDFKVTQEFLASNGLPETQFSLIDLNKEPFPSDIQADLVISLLSWGFHYPLETYLDQVLEILSEAGCLVIDLRKNEDGVVNIMKLFGHVQLIDETFRHVRILDQR